MADGIDQVQGDQFIGQQTERPAVVVLGRVAADQSDKMCFYFAGDFGLSAWSRLFVQRFLQPAREVTFFRVGDRSLADHRCLDHLLDGPFLALAAVQQQQRPCSRDNPRRFRA
jgi:hypothetical protein